LAAASGRAKRRAEPARGAAELGRGPVLRVSKKNSLFQEWLALKQNRQKRHRSGRFLVEGTTAIDSAVQHGWRLDALLYPAGRRLSSWAEQHLAGSFAERRVEIDPELLAELTERHEGTELLGIAYMQERDLPGLELAEPWLALAIDRPKSPNNLGTIIRAAVAFDAAAVIVTGHAADPFDPACVRASVGTLFDVPLVRLPSQGPLLAWIEERRSKRHISLVGTGQAGTVLADRVDLTGNTVIVLGNETEGLSQAYRAACDCFVRLPTSVRQPSLNVAAAAAILLYEVQRQRGASRA
jgi:23S rRNA (uridine2479-2'-O)-methyltransferase